MNCRRDACAPGRAERILELLKSRLGPRAAITAGQIADRLFGDRGLDRQVRLIITDLITAHGHGEIIASTGGDAFPGSPPGYFWAENPQQIEAYCNVLLSRGDELKARLEAAWAAEKRMRGEAPEQPEFPIAGEPHSAGSGQAPAPPGITAGGGCATYGFQPIGRKKLNR